MYTVVKKWLVKTLIYNGSVRDNILLGSPNLYRYKSTLQNLHSVEISSSSQNQVLQYKNLGRHRKEALCKLCLLNMQNTN